MSSATGLAPAATSPRASRREPDPDGITLGLATVASTTNATLHQKPQFGVLRGFWPVIFAGTAPIALVVQASAPVDTVQDRIELAKAQRMQINRIC